MAFEAGRCCITLVEGAMDVNYLFAGSYEPAPAPTFNTGFAFSRAGTMV
jgi:hypothetical protein